MRKLTYRIIRKIAAIFFVLIIWLTLLYAFITDFDHKRREEKQRLFGDINIKALNYKLEFTSFDMITQSITGALRLEIGLQKWNEQAIYYAPLAYTDFHGGFHIPIGTLLFQFKTLVPPSSFTEKIPEPINVSFRAIGLPESYPFDKYYIAGKVKCLAYFEKDNKKSYLHKEQKNESLSIKNSINGLFIRIPNENELHNLSTKIKKADFFLSERHKKYIQVDELKKFNNLDDSFILIIERPQFIRYIQ